MQKIWLKHNPAGVPAQVKTDVYASLVALLDDSFGQHRDKPACRFMGKAFSFGQIDATRRALATWRQASGRQRGDHVASMLPNVQQCPLAVAAVLRRVQKPVPPFACPPGVVGTRFNDAMARGSRLALAPAAVGPDAIAVLQYTAGTTGVSKGAVLLHRNLVANILQAEAWYQPAFKKIPAGQQIVTMCALPLHHIFGFNTTMMLGLRLGGCGLLIANHADVDKVDWSRLKFSVGGGMAVTQGTARLWLHKTGCPICDGHGLSETSPSATRNPVDSSACSGTIGLPMPNTELALRDGDGHAVATGQPGQIAIRSPRVMAGCCQRPDQAAKVMTADGVMRTGDVGVMDERGHVRVVDRKKDMILVSGFNVSANAFCAANLTGCKRPRLVGFCVDLPKTTVGKSLRRALREGQQ